MSQTRGIDHLPIAEAAEPTVRAQPLDRDWVAIARASVPWVLLAGLLGVMLWSRMIQPSDLHDDDQSKTMAYTVDMIRNHQFALPRDMYRQPATKPPMYNWLTIPFIYAFQSWKPWVYKFPSILAAVATCGLIVLAARSFFGSNASRPLQLPQPAPASINPSMLPLGIGIVAAAIFLASQPVNRMMYLARPDMLLTAFLTGAWVFGTVALLKTEGSTKREAALFWLCIAGAALTKGPPALAVLAYVLIAAPLIGRNRGGALAAMTSGTPVPRQHENTNVIDYRAGYEDALGHDLSAKFLGIARESLIALRRLHWWYAIPLLLLPLAAWMTLGYFQAGRQFFDVYIHQEMLSRMSGGGPEGIEAKPWWQMPVWFFQRFSPWSVITMAAVLGIPLRKWSRHVLTPAILWTVLVMIFFSIPGGKRADYLLPIYPPAALAASFVLLVAGSWLGITANRAMVVVVLVALYIVAYPDRNRRVITSDPTEEFVAKIAPMIKKDPLVVVSVAGYQPLLPLLGRFDGTPPIPLEGDFRKLWLDQLVNARWVILPKTPRWTGARAISGDLPGGRNGRTIQMALYRIGDENSPTKNDVRNMYRRRQTGTSSNTVVPEESPAAATAPSTAPRPRRGARVPATSPQ